MGDWRVHGVTLLAVLANLALLQALMGLFGGAVTARAAGWAAMAAGFFAGAIWLRNHALDRVTGHPSWFRRFARSLRLTRSVLVVVAGWAFSMAAIAPGPDPAKDGPELFGAHGESVGAVVAGIAALVCTRLMRPTRGWRLL